ncbi:MULTISPECIES: FAD:protein FMN transferase [Cupriavidus]|uniref:FAD:protein FMN transferase n=1 Tax=Cupriavidus pinatubonensis (strain JMP 134 / LMG 1197) TaxID=264198 RepID=Q46QS3_CUPPJ|nr:MULTISPECIES: FAD:protein FMN transferase [Cupriavidus]TPQ33137.1 FAD:protein FMN transferase [Cupriavidus pinatubonensis]
MSKMSIEGAPDLQLKRFRVTGATMGTRYSATFHASPETDESELAAELAAAVGAVDEQMSNWKDSSDLSRLNRAEPNCWVQVSGNLAALLVRALEIGRDTHNAFNIGVGDLVGMWGFGPSGEQRAHRPGGVGTSRASPCPPVSDLIDVDVQQCRVRKREPVALDLCGIAKGFGVDELARVLSEHGIGSWLVGIDGEMRARGSKPDGPPWAIALEAPDYDRHAAMAVIELSNAAIATSGDYRHWADIDGTRVSHTMDPRTGAPLCGSVASVTVLAPTCADADAYATALLVLGLQAGRDYAHCRRLDALFIVRDGDALRAIGTGCFANVQ